MYYCKVLAAALARMRRYRTHHPHRSCGWLRQAKAAESLIAVPAFYIPARRMGGAQRYPSIAVCEDDGFREGLNPSYGLRADASELSQ